MKYIFALLFVGVMVTAQVKKEELNVMPWPQNISLNEGNFSLNKDFKINITGAPNSRVYGAATRFLRRLDGRTGLFFTQGFITKLNQEPTAQLQINCTKSGKIGLYEDESYHLDIESDKITINATSDLGAIHALETLLQLMQNNATSFYFPNSTISDFPRFAWRGLMLDVSRHFQPIDVVKRNIDAMAAVKMNVFHWHLVDDQGWRIEMKKHPKLTEVASDGLFYTQEEIKGIVKYADERGILVVPEIDVPGHGTAILTAYPEVGSKVISIAGGTVEKNAQASGFQTYTLERNAGIFSPTLDPTNPKTYQLLSEIFDEVCPLFPGDYFHIGGDENEGKDWDANAKIQAFKKKNKLETNHDLQTYFTMKLVPMLKKHGKQLMGWEEIMTKDMSKDAIIHSWRGAHEGMQPGESLVKAAKNGYKTVLSNGFYIDLLLSVDTHYLNDPMPKNANFSDVEKARILGGEATMWTELASPATIDSRIWPRTIAIAERLWSAEDITDLESMHKRLAKVSVQLEELGITHLKNKEVLLRNISNNQNVEALRAFSNVCEPLKGYTRNKGGTEYQMYSPLTLFADLCVPDAPDAMAFAKVVDAYLLKKDKDNKAIVIGFLNKWIVLNNQLNNLAANAPLVQPLLPLVQNLSDASKQIVLLLDGKKVDGKSLLELVEKCNTKEHADVELAVYSSLKKLI
ncbi:beta-N-acetylhexosaminidase [Flavobacterium sp. TAB 87]|uniref:beta-N-acetylhexosaminidase n=1 Tax=Flavobacterium sp. TAB 87 TaxID=1729581 RepID=UPI00076BEFC2|nr:family 20 glycosylhydrolase [Flavobacterium sp. TAB 87]KVV14954.1 Beta-hexosaminidase [Flavobacterium sp. TAB 87]